MASQNRNPAAACFAAAGEAAEPGEGPCGQEVRGVEVTGADDPMMSGNKGPSAFPESDHLFKWVRTIHGAAGSS